MDRVARIPLLKIVTIAVCFAVGLPIAYAQSSADVSATAFADIPAEAVLEVRAGRDLPLERDLVDEVSKRLIARGYVVAQRGSIVVTVEGTAPVPGVAMANPNSGEDGFRVLDTPKGDSAVQVPFNRDEAKPSAAIFKLRMSAYRPGQSNLWVGSASGPDNGGGRRATTFALAQDLIAVFGRSTARPDAE